MRRDIETVIKHGDNDGQTNWLVSVVGPAQELN